MKWKTIKLRTFKVNMLFVIILWQYLKVARCPHATLLVIVVVLVAVSPVYSKDSIMSILPLETSRAAVKVAELQSRKVVCIAATARRIWKFLTNPISWVMIPAPRPCETFSRLFRQKTSWWLAKFVIIRIFVKFALITVFWTHDLSEVGSSTVQSRHTSQQSSRQREKLSTCALEYSSCCTDVSSDKSHHLKYASWWPH